MADVTIYGAGVFGLSIAWSCITRGAKVRVIEKKSVGAGSSGSPVGALSPHTPDNWNVKKKFQLDSLMMSKKYWTDLEYETGSSTGFMNSGRIQAIQDQRQLILAKERVEGAKVRWGNSFVWEVVDESKLLTWRPISKTGLYIYDNLSSVITPNAALSVLSEAIVRSGSEIIIGQAREQGKVLYAAGYEELENISEVLKKPLGIGVKGQALIVKYDARELPQISVNGVHAVPHFDGTVAIGSTTEKAFSDATNNDFLLDDLYQDAILNLPILKKAEVITRWAGVRPSARKRLPILGKHPVYQGAYIANGGFKIGFSLAPKVAEVMADYILYDIDNIPKTFKV
ncbi:MAG: NAD(P)/FAD-dependent oxidoreductase [Paracoccaceae bacterium]